MTLWSVATPTRQVLILCQQLLALFVLDVDYCINDALLRNLSSLQEFWRSRRSKSEPEAVATGQGFKLNNGMFSS
jgi:hypothetical protein